MQSNDGRYFARLALLWGLTGLRSGRRSWGASAHLHWPLLWVSFAVWLGSPLDWRFGLRGKRDGEGGQVAAWLGPFRPAIAWGRWADADGRSASL